MTTRNNRVERRRQDRFKVKEGVFVALMPGNKVGQIKEIGKGGLSFEYVDDGTPANNPTRVDIFSSVYDFYLRNVPVKSIVDIEIECSVPISSIPMKQLHLQFGKISSTQKMLLEFFLQKYTLK